jgi:acyl-coenzyme A thioesterase PaaI-like protein
MAVEHDCIGCREIVAEHDGVFSLRFGSRFQGPPGNANGGVVAGVLTCIARRVSSLDDPAVRRLTARLHLGIPQARDLAVGVTVRDDGVIDLTVSDGDALLVTGAVELVESDVLRAGLPSELWGADRIEPIVDLADPDAVQRSFADAHPWRRPGPDSPFLHCFVCGSGNVDGLRVGAEPIAAGSAWAANPHASAFAEADGRLDTVIAVASLDCPSTPSFYGLPVLAEDEAVLLGTYDVEFCRVPPATPPGGWRLPSRFLRRDGRRIFADIGLVDGAGTLYALATATWITVPSPAVA